LRPEYCSRSDEEAPAEAEAELNQVRVNAQLIDAESDAHLWAERFDRDIGDLFALQDEITGRIAITLNLELVRAEALRTNSPRRGD
jgi:hypothetical protein